MEKLKGLKGLFRRSQRVYVGPSSPSSSASRSTSRSKSSSKSSKSSASRRNKQRTRRNRITQLDKKLQEDRDFQEYEMENIRKLANDSVGFSYSSPMREEARNKLEKADKKLAKLKKKAASVEALKDDLDLFEKIEDAPNLSKAQKRALKKKWNELWTKWRSSEYGTSEYRRLNAEVDDFEEMVNSGNIHM